jgi:hypothetical protein
LFSDSRGPPRGGTLPQSQRRIAGAVVEVFAMTIPHGSFDKIIAALDFPREGVEPSRLEFESFQMDPNSLRRSDIRFAS